MTLINAHQSIVLKFFTYYAEILTYYAGIIPLCFWSPIMLKIMLYSIICQRLPPFPPPSTAKAGGNYSASFLELPMPFLIPRSKIIYVPEYPERNTYFPLPPLPRQQKRLEETTQQVF